MKTSDEKKATDEEIAEMMPHLRKKLTEQVFGADSLALIAAAERVGLSCDAVDKKFVKQMFDSADEFSDIEALLPIIYSNMEFYLASDEDEEAQRSVAEICASTH